MPLVALNRRKGDCPGLPTAATIGWLGPGAYTPPNKLTCGKVGRTNLDQEGRNKNVPALT